MDKLQFNLSPSMLKLYDSSQFQFFKQYIEKADPDTHVIQCYGVAGQLCHTVLEDLANNPKLDIKKRFEELWKEKNLDKMYGFNGKPLNKDIYFNAVYRGAQVLKKFNKFKTEERIEFPLIDNKKAKINIKGFIDLQILDNDQRWILDWKTSSSVDEGFRKQTIHYAYSIWKKYKIVPSKLIVAYIKIGISKIYYTTEKELIEYDKYLKSIAKEILKKGTDSNNYEMGDWDNPFNAHKKACEEEYKRRQNTHIIEIIRNGAGAKIITPISNDLLKGIVKHCSYELPNSHFIKVHSGWDGKIRLFNANKKTFPIGLISRIEKVIKDYGRFTGKNYKIKYIDKRKELPDIKMPDQLRGVTLRDYQVEAIKIAMENEILILELMTGTGKTLLATEIIRRMHKKTLFIVNRIELARQTKNVFDNTLNINTKLITQGFFEDDDVCVATYQTIMTLLKKHDTKIIEYLASIELCIFDETHIVACKSILYISSKLINVKKRLGISGTAFRDDGEDMKIEAVVGKIKYRYKKEALNSGYLAKPDITFIKIKNEEPEDDFIDHNEEYEEFIVNNNLRNNKIIELVLKIYKDKQILLLTKRIKHAEILKEKLNAEMIIGSSNAKYRKKIFEDFRAGKIRVLVGTMSIFQLGIDIPELDVIINCAANSAKVGTIQTLGRVLRKGKDKTTGYYIDFIDEGTKYLLPASWKRFKTLKNEGHKPKISEV